jgi:hypothetical protein
MRIRDWEHQKHLPALMPKKAPNLLPWLGGVKPSDMRQAHPRDGEVLDSRTKVVLEHHHREHTKPDTLSLPLSNREQQDIHRA